MAKCIDCVHQYCCKYDRFFGVDEVENKCNYFKNKADFVEVVRCKDCGSYNKHYGECTLNGSHFGGNGYCCRGTRTPKERGGEKRNGVYRYEERPNPYDRSNIYDVGTLVLDVKETETSLQLKVIEKDMRYSTYVDVLFGDKDKVNINKEKSRHRLIFGNGWFIVYPNRMGKPLCFVKGGANG